MEIWDIHPGKMNGWTPIKMEVCFRWFLFFNWVVCRFCWFIFRGVMKPIFGWIQQSLQGTVIYEGTVDGRNPAPVNRYCIPLFTGFYTSQVVQDFFHQQYDHFWKRLQQSLQLPLWKCATWKGKGNFFHAGVDMTRLGHWSLETTKQYVCFL